MSCAVLTCRGTPVSVRGERGNWRAAIGESGVDGRDPVTLDCNISVFNMHTYFILTHLPF